MPQLVSLGEEAFCSGVLRERANVSHISGSLAHTDSYIATTVHAIAGELQLEIYCIPLSSNGYVVWCLIDDHR